MAKRLQTPAITEGETINNPMETAQEGIDPLLETDGSMEPPLKKSSYTSDCVASGSTQCETLSTYEFCKKQKFSNGAVCDLYEFLPTTVNVYGIYIYYITMDCLRLVRYNTVLNKNDRVYNLLYEINDNNVEVCISNTHICIFTQYTTHLDTCQLINKETGDIKIYNFKNSCNCAELVAFTNKYIVKLIGFEQLHTILEVYNYDHHVICRYSIDWIHDITSIKANDQYIVAYYEKTGFYIFDISNPLVGSIKVIFINEFRGAEFNAPINAIFYIVDPRLNGVYKGPDFTGDPESAVDTEVPYGGSIEELDIIRKHLVVAPISIDYSVYNICSVLKSKYNIDTEPCDSIPLTFELKSGVQISLKPETEPSGSLPMSLQIKLAANKTHTFQPIITFLYNNVYFTLTKQNSNWAICSKIQCSVDYPVDYNRFITNACDILYFSKDNQLVVISTNTRKTQAFKLDYKLFDYDKLLMIRNSAVYCIQNTHVYTNPAGELYCVHPKNKPERLQLQATPVAPAVQATPVAPAVQATPVAPAVQATPVEPAVQATPVAPAVQATPVAPAVQATPVEPAEESELVDGEESECEYSVSSVSSVDEEVDYTNEFIITVHSLRSSKKLNCCYEELVNADVPDELIHKVMSFITSVNIFTSIGEEIIINPTL